MSAAGEVPGARAAPARGARSTSARRSSAAACSWASILFIFSRVWQVIGVARGTARCRRRRELVWYLALTEWAVLSVPMVFLAIEADVRSGDIACRLVRPVVVRRRADRRGARRDGRAPGRARSDRVPRSRACSRAGCPRIRAGCWLALPLGAAGERARGCCRWRRSGCPRSGSSTRARCTGSGRSSASCSAVCCSRSSSTRTGCARSRASRRFPSLCWAAGRSAFGFAPGEARGAVRRGLWSGRRCSRSGCLAARAARARGSR